MAADFEAAAGMVSSRKTRRRPVALTFHRPNDVSGAWMSWMREVSRPKALFESLRSDIAGGAE
jgi:hypothetical protein